MERLEAAFVGESPQAMWRIFKMLPEVKTVLEPTYGRGRFYKLTPWLQVTGGDIDKARAKDVRCDMRYLPFRDKSFDCVALDPPFLHSSRKKGTKVNTYKIFGGRQCQTTQGLLDLYTLAGREAFRVASKAVVIKCNDMVYDETGLIPFGHRLMNVFGEPWEIVVSIRPSGLLPATRGKVSHFRHNYVYYLVWKL